jgi:hypothetical protein
MQSWFSRSLLAWALTLGLSYVAREAAATSQVRIEVSADGATGLAAKTGASRPDDYPRVVIGCWQLTERSRSEDAAVATLAAYWSHGFQHFDTADIYGELCYNFKNGSLGCGAQEPIPMPRRNLTRDAFSHSALASGRHVANKRDRDAIPPPPPPPSA